MKSFRVMLKRLVIGLVAFALLGFTVILLEQARHNQLTDELLTKHSTEKWAWQREKGFWGRRDSDDTQVRVSADNVYLLRRAYSDHYVMAYLEDPKPEHVEKFSFHGVWLRLEAGFRVDCDEGATGAGFTCIKLGNGDAFLRWRVSVPVDDLEDLPTWDSDRGGFSVKEDFGNSRDWDFKPAQQHLTLQKLKPNTEDSE